MPSAELRRGEPARSLGLLGLLCLLAAAWLAWPRPHGVPDELPRLRCVLIDASAPVRRRMPGYAGHLSRLAAREAAAARESGDELALALFDRGARWWCPPSAPDRLLERLANGDARIGPPESSARCDLAAGLELARDALLAPGRPPGSLLIVGDGTARGRDPEPLLAELATRGVELRFEALPEPSAPDARVHELRLPSRSESGAPLTARLAWSLDMGADGRQALGSDAQLRLVCDFRDARGTRRIERVLELPADSAPQHTTIELGAAREGAIVLEARVELTGGGALRAGDALPENDVARAAGRVGSALVALALAPREQLAELRDWLDGATPGIDWIVSAPQESATAPEDVDLVCSFDLAPHELPGPRIDAVLARGGGWFHAGGWTWLESPRTEGARRLAERLPLAAADPGGPPVERLFLVDGSGSMRGDPFAAVRGALEEILPMVRDRDRVVLQLFSSGLGPRVVLAEAHQPAGEAALARLRAMRVPGGSTMILDCLEIIARGELEPPAERASILLLTDGRDRNALQVADRGQRIRESLRGQQRELSALAAGADANEDFLRLLVGDDGRLASTEDFDAVLEIFREEVGAERTLVGDDARALPAKPTTPTLARELAAAFPADIVFERAVRAAASDGAGVLLAAPDGSPLLALRRAAGGTTAALVTRPGAEWGGALRAVDLAPVWRALARGHARETSVVARVEDRRLVLEGVPPEAPARFPVELWRERGTARERVASFEVYEPTAASGRDLGGLRTAELPGDVHESAGGELVLRSADPPLAVPLSALAGAAYLPAARRAFRAPSAVASSGSDPREGRGPHPAMPWVLGLGLLATFAGALSGILRSESEA